MNKTVVRIAGAVILIVLTLFAITLPQVYRTVICIIVGFPSLVLMIISRKQLGSSFSVSPKAKELVTKGFYSRIQHPLYFFLDLILIAVIIVIGLKWLLIFWCILAIMHLLQSRREEKILASAFGTEYDSYSAKTWF